MNIEEILCAGDDILEEVAQAINTNNYTGLGQKIADRVKTAREDSGQNTTGRTGDAKPVSRQEQKTSRGYKASANRTGPDQQPRTGYSTYRQTQNNFRQPQPGYGQYRQAQFRFSPYVNSHFLLQKPGKGGPTMRMVLGGLGLFAFGLPALFCLIDFLVGNGGASMLSFFIVTGIFAVGAGILLRSGLKKRKLISRYYDYGRRLGDAEYISIPEFAAQNGLDEKEVRSSLTEMMRRGYLPQAHLDNGQNTLILTDHAYNLYRQAEHGRMQREEEMVRKQKEEAVHQKRLQTMPEAEREIQDILDRGNAYIKKVRNVNDMIPDTEEMSTKLYRLEEITHKIFEQVKKQPEAAASLRRFMDYYLPTTEKLLDAYVELDRQPTEGDNIVKTKREIDEAMDVINDAFENLLNSLFENMDWDISSDISVMKTMLAQDGLTQKELLPR